MNYERAQNDFVGLYTPNLMYHSIFAPPIKVEPTFIQNPSSSDDSFQEESSNVLNGSPCPNNYTTMDLAEVKRSKPQKCKECGKVLSSTSSYYVHLKKHSNNKPYHCTVCDASFCRKPYLEVHMRTHTGEKPFECEVCKKRFTQKSSLNTHKRSHTGLRPYICKICNKSFSVKSYLAAHQWSHAASNGISCNVCQSTFNSRPQYEEHLRSHSSKGFECQYCPRFFAKESYLIRHKSKVHYKLHNANNSTQNTQNSRSKIDLL